MGSRTRTHRNPSRGCPGEKEEAIYHPLLLGELLELWPKLMSWSFSQDIKPTVLIGTSGQGKTFTKEVIEAMSDLNEVFSLFSSSPLFRLDVCICFIWICYMIRDNAADVYLWPLVETSYSRFVKSDITIRMYCWRSLHMEPGEEVWIIRKIF